MLAPEQAERVPLVLVSVGRCYVQCVNHTYGRTRTLWDGRYKFSLVPAETDLLLGQRRVELKPVHAGMVADPALYRWFSYPASAIGELGALLTPHARHIGLGDDEDARRAAYREHFRIAPDDKPPGDLRLALDQDQPVGNDRFYRESEAMTGQRCRLRKRGRPRKLDEPQ
ncbi:hypothetical protein [Thiocapsa bogorovii]|uniref:hypothetical protein n=1 Tax=Thiocapsa bogorovii TaxID=521689 RepID=UPI001E32A02A|nr:hypothetical protein [Thiocapsa bogorovii]UHD17818.1 hypothetical protein LT988_07155 [Thiocapsa bogorovii]